MPTSPLASMSTTVSIHMATGPSPHWMAICTYDAAHKIISTMAQPIPPTKAAAMTQAVLLGQQFHMANPKKIGPTIARQ